MESQETAIIKSIQREDFVKLKTIYKFPCVNS